MPREPATQRQLDFIRDLGGADLITPDLSKAKASRLITKLKENPTTMRRMASPRQRAVLRFFDLEEHGEHQRAMLIKWMDDFYARDPARKEAWEKYKAETGDNGSYDIDTAGIERGAFARYMPEASAERVRQLKGIPIQYDVGPSEASMAVTRAAHGCGYIIAGLFILVPLAIVVFFVRACSVIFCR